VKRSVSARGIFGRGARDHARERLLVKISRCAYTIGIRWERAAEGQRRHEALSTQRKLLQPGRCLGKNAAAHYRLNDSVWESGIARTGLVGAVVKKIQ